MKKNLLTAGLLSLSMSAGAQVVSTVDDGGVFFVGENALVYNGGGMQTRGTGQYDIRGNMMVVGGGTDAIRTLNTAGGEKTDGGNIVLRFNNPNDIGSSTYGQLYINGITQSNVTGTVDKEYLSYNHGSYQQLGLPFYKKRLSTLSAEFGKVFSDIRRSHNEILIYDNAKVEPTSIQINSQETPTPFSYYMVGAKGLDFSTPASNIIGNAPTPAGTVFTLRGIPAANGLVTKLRDAGAAVNFGLGGNNNNSYGGKYNTYLQDDWDYQKNTAAPYDVPTFGKNIYQFGNPYFTNLDLSNIARIEPGTATDGNSIPSLRGIRYDPGEVVSTGQGASYSLNARFINFNDAGAPVGDVGLIIKPLQTFVIKLKDNTIENATEKTLSFDGLRRFKSTIRTSGEYGVTAARQNGAGNGTVKQLAMIALDVNNQEIGRAYYVVYPTATTGHTEQNTTQATLGASNIIGTYEEDAISGGIDQNYANSYWLYINEANENNFMGKAIPLALYSDDIKSLQFEIREDANLLADGIHALSTGVGFHYKGLDGVVREIKQNEIVPVSSDEYALYYGAPTILATDAVAKPSRTRVLFNTYTDEFFVRFDPQWKSAHVQVFDMSGKLIITKSNVTTSEDYKLNLQNHNSAYIVTAVSEKGEKFSGKIVR